MNEDFVTSDLAKKLKEKGFIGNVDIGQYGGYYYHDGEDIDVCYDCVDNADIAANEYLRPTISQVLKWLREEKDIDIAILPVFVDYYKKEYKVIIYAPCLGEPYDSGYFHSYEKAELFAINYVIDNLI